MTKEQKIKYWGNHMWLPHWMFVVITFCMYFVPTLFLLIRDGYNQSMCWFYIWGFTFGIGLNIFTPMVIKYRKLYNQLKLK